MSEDLRTDQRQWLIYQEEPVTAGMEAIEAMALTVSGTLLANNEHVEIRAIGNIMLLWADARHRVLSGEGATDAERVAIDMATEVLEWMGGSREERPDKALDQLHAVAFEFDSQLNASGINGESWRHTIARGEHGR